MLSVFFAPLSSLIVMVGEPLVIKHGKPKDHGISNLVIRNSLTALCDGLLFMVRGKHQMKRFLILLTMLFGCTAFAQTETINWYMDGNTYATTTCESGDDILLPAAPIKRGYTFKGWLNYQPIEYLESTGTQYIDTGVIGNLNTRWIVDFMNIVPSTDFQSAIIGGNIKNNTKAISILLTLQNQTLRTCRFGDKEADIPSGRLYNNVRYIVQTDKDGLLLDNREYLIPFGTQNYFETEGTLWLFMYNAKTGLPLSEKRSSFRVYSSRLYDNDVLVRDFIPILDHNGTPCMYDKVEKKFYYNQGTGQFIAGPAI